MAQFQLLIALIVLSCTSGTNAAEVNDYILKELLKLRMEVDKLREAQSSVKSASSTYVRWGRSTCDGDAIALYRGYAAGALYTQIGSGANFLCLHEKPQFKRYLSGAQFLMGHIFGVEYELFDGQNNIFSYANNNGHTVGNHAAPCVVCLVPSRPTSVMIPARTECPTGWTLEYGGYIMTAHYSHFRSSFLCWDEAPETAAGGSNQDPAVIYPTEIRCGSLPCGKYVNGLELTCVVCTK